MYSLRIFHPSAKVWMKRGIKDFFAVYVAFGLSTVATIGFMYQHRDGLQIVRYKSEYTIFRPTDGETRMYPRSYITDNKLLSNDHPTKLDECDELPRGLPYLGRTYRKFSFMVN